MSVSNGPNLGRIISAADGDAFGTDFRKLLRALDVLLQNSVISITLATPPGSPTNGDRYIVAASPTGAWSGKAKNIAVWTTDNPASPSGVWEFYPPAAGWRAYNVADTTIYIYDGSAWGALSGGGGGGEPVQKVTIPLTSAQLLTLQSTPIQVIPAPGAGKVINLLQAMIVYTFVSTPYSLGDNANLELTASGNSLTLLNIAGILGLSFDLAAAFLTTWGSPPSTLDNQPIDLTFDGTADITAGDGTAVLTIYYFVVTL